MVGAAVLRVVVCQPLLLVVKCWWPGLKRPGLTRIAQYPSAHVSPACMRCMPAGAVAAASATAAAPRQKHPAATVVSLFSAETRPTGARLLFQHAPYQSLDRPMPTALESSLFEEY